MNKKEKAQRINQKVVEEVFEDQQFEKSNTLIFGGVLIAICSIGLLIFVLSEKVFHLN